VCASKSFIRYKQFLKRIFEQSIIGADRLINTASIVTGSGVQANEILVGTEQQMFLQILQF
jgi:hypothetical protein